VFLFANKDWTLIQSKRWLPVFGKTVWVFIIMMVQMKSTMRANGKYMI
jgi:hypothetical protein